MNKTQFTAKNAEKLSPLKPLLKVAGVVDNYATTKQIAVKPIRQSLAIFTPRIYQSVNSRHTILLGIIPVYDGLIRPNTIPFLGNKSSRLFAVVETRCHFGNFLLTEQIGGNHA